MTPPICALYLRVSTQEQTTLNQRAPLEQLARARGFERIEVVEETASGARERPRLDELCERARTGEIAAIAVVSIDRISRSALDLLQRVEKLDAAGCRLLSVRDGWLDHTGPQRQLMLAVLAGCAELERGILRERTRAGIARARAQGKPLGRPRASPVALAAAAVLVAQGQNLTNAAKQYRLGRSTLARFIQSQKPAPRRETDSNADRGMDATL